MKQDRASPARQPTVKEVALLAGVSPMTVSRTLGGGASVRPEVQKRVMDAVAMLGYQKNENARSIRPGQPSGLVGVVITNINNPYYGEFAVGVEDVASEHGRRIIFGTTREQPTLERRLIADLIGRQVEGLIMVPAGGPSDHLQPERLRGIPLVLASRELPDLIADAVVLDDWGGAIMGTRSLISSGHTRIGFLGYESPPLTRSVRFEGFRTAMGEAGLVVDEALVRLGQREVNAAERAAAEILDQNPTAIFCANNRNTVGALKAIGALLAAGRDASSLPAIMSFDSFELSDLMPVSVTVIEHDARQLGRESARMLFERLLNPKAQRSPHVVHMPTSFS